MIEREYKLLLTKQEYGMLLEKHTWTKSYTQTNYYYDTPEFTLHKRGVTVRVRKKEQDYRLQIKQAKAQTHVDYAARQETETTIANAPGKLHIKQASAEPLELLGALTTLRKELQVGQVLMCLDENVYLGVTDWELELEFTGEKAEAEALLESSNLPQRALALGKYGRFVTRLWTQKIG